MLSYMLKFFHVVPQRGHPILPPIKHIQDMHITIILTESLISSLTSAYPPSLLQVSL